MKLLLKLLFLVESIIILKYNNIITTVYGQILQGENNDVCNIITFIPFTDKRVSPIIQSNDKDAYSSSTIYGYGSWPNAESVAKAGYTLLATAEMAKRHFNERDPIIVPELANLHNCDITMPNITSVHDDTRTAYIDTGYERRYTIRQFQDVIKKIIDNGMELDNEYCAIISPQNEFVASGISIYSESLRIPQIGYATIGTRLNNVNEYPSFIRIIPNAYDFGSIIPKFIQRGDIYTRQVVAIIYDITNDYGEQFESPIEEAEEIYNEEFITITEDFRQNDNDSIREALVKVQKRGYYTIIIVTDQPNVLSNIANIANELNMLGSKYFYIISGHALPPEILNSIKYKIDSPIDRMLRGSALFTNYDKFIYNESNNNDNTFLRVWKEQNGTELIPILNKIVPLNEYKQPLYIANETTFFQNVIPTLYSSFLYDAIIAAGISACESVTSENNANEKEEEENKDPLIHIHQILKTQFQGASGDVKFQKSVNSGENDNDEEKQQFTNTRDAEDVIFGMYNIRPKDDIDENNNMRGYESVLTHLYRKGYKYINEKTGKEEVGAWQPVNGTEFLFYDGTSNEPMPLRDTFNAHYISNGIYITGLTLSSIAFVVSVITCILVSVNRNDRLIKASQPEFLYLLCIGAALVGASTFFVSFDEDKGVDGSHLDALCSAFPWFFIIGYLTMYCALFSKLWRLSQLMQFRRRVVQIKQVLLPFCVLIACSFVTLIVLQVVAPLEWEREPISQGEEPYETYGECSSEQGFLPFVIPLGILLLLAVGTTAYFSWKMRDVQSELSESRWIFAGIFVHIQTWLVGAPVVYITDGVSRDASYLMMVVLAFTFSTSLVTFIIWPKIIVLIREKYFDNNTSAQTKNKPKISVSKETCGTRVSGLVISSQQSKYSNSKDDISNSNTGHVIENSVFKESYRELKTENNKLQAELRELHALLRQSNVVVAPEQRPLVNSNNNNTEYSNKDNNNTTPTMTDNNNEPLSTNKRSSFAREQFEC